MIYIIEENDLERLIKSEIVDLLEENIFKDEMLSRFKLYYDFINNNEGKLINDISMVDNKSVMYSKYFWHTKFKNRYLDLFGYDAGIEQQSFKLLEECENKLEGGVDWEIIEEIEKNIKKE